MAAKPRVFLEQRDVVALLSRTGVAVSAGDLAGTLELPAVEVLTALRALVDAGVVRRSGASAI